MDSAYTDPHLVYDIIKKIFVRFFFSDHDSAGVTDMVGILLDIEVYMDMSLIEVLCFYIHSQIV